MNDFFLPLLPFSIGKSELVDPLLEPSSLVLANVYEFFHRKTRHNETRIATQRMVTNEE